MKRIKLFFLFLLSLSPECNAASLPLVPVKDFQENVDSISLDNKGKTVSYGLNAFGGYDADGYLFSLGSTARVGRFDDRFNLLLGLKYLHISSYIEHQLVIPVAVNWNMAKLKNASLYVGVGCDVCIVSTETGFSHWNFRKGDGDLYPSLVGISFGFSSLHYDWNICTKVNEDFRVLGTCFTYYF